MRKWLKECHAWLDDPESVQYTSIQIGEWINWYDGCCVDPVSCPHLTWRIKPKTLSINGREFEAPVAENRSGNWIRICQYNAQKDFFHATPEARDLHYKILVEESTPK